MNTKLALLTIFIFGAIVSFFGVWLVYTVNPTIAIGLVIYVIGNNACEKALKAMVDIEEE